MHQCLLFFFKMVMRAPSQLYHVSDALGKDRTGCSPACSCGSMVFFKKTKNIFALLIFHHHSFDSTNRLLVSLPFGRLFLQILFFPSPPLSYPFSFFACNGAIELCIVSF